STGTARAAPTASSHHGGRSHEPPTLDLAGAVAATRLPRRSAEKSAGRAATGRRHALASLPVTRREHPADRPADRLRRDVRPTQTLLPVPHVLRPRRHPQPRRGPARLEAELHRRRTATHRRRTA